MTTTEGTMERLYHNTSRDVAERIEREGFRGIVYLASTPVQVCDSQTWVVVELDGVAGLRRDVNDSGLYHADVYRVSARVLNRRACAMYVLTAADLDAESVEGDF